MNMKYILHNNQVFPKVYIKPIALKQVLKLSVVHYVA